MQTVTASLPSNPPSHIDKDISVVQDKRRLNTPEVGPEKHPRTENGSPSEDQTKTRKKPGRKPATTEPASKRLAQNRAAQRAFRERKDNYVRELELKIQELEEAHQAKAKENELLQKRLLAVDKDFVLEKESELPPSSTSTALDQELSPESVSSESSPDSASSEEPPINNENDTPDQSQTKETPLTINNESESPVLTTELAPELTSTSTSQILPSTPIYANSDYLFPFVPSPASAGVPETNMFTQGIMGFGYNPLDDFSMFPLGVMPPPPSSYNLLPGGIMLPSSIENFHPVMYADYLQYHDPFSMAPVAESTDGLLPGAINNPILNAPNSDFNLHPMPGNTTTGHDDFDLDNLCSMLKDKATCSEMKKFLNVHCPNNTS